MKAAKFILLILTLSICVNSCAFTLPGIPGDGITTENNAAVLSEDYASYETSEEVISVSTTQAAADDETTEETAASTYEEATKTASVEITTSNNESTTKKAEIAVTKQAEETTKTEPSSATRPVETTSKKEEPTTEKAALCTLTIECRTILNNTDSLKVEKKKYIPADGIIINLAECEILEGDTVFSVLKRVCENNSCEMNCSYCQKSGIPIEYNYTPAFNNYYIEGIHHLYEKDCGYLSGWMYSVNGVFPTTGISTYKVKEGDNISILYTCDMGEDIGNSF